LLRLVAHLGIKQHFLAKNSSQLAVICNSLHLKPVELAFHGRFGTAIIARACIPGLLARDN
jgi:hypothetical protein